MTRLTPENPKVVWESERSSFSGPDAWWCIPYECEVAGEFPIGARIRITAEVIGPDAKAEGTEVQG